MNNTDKTPPTDTKTVKVGFLLIESFSLLCVAAMTNPFRSANRELGHTAYSWEFLTPDNQPASASDGVPIQPTLDIKTTEKFDYFLVVAGIECDPPNRAALNAALQRLSRNSSVFGGICTAPFILARAGFLNDCEFTLHWENQPAFAEEFPHLEFSPNLYVMDGDRWTGSGGLSSMDMALSIIAIHHGQDIANAVGNQYQIDRVRGPSIGQRPFSLNRYETLPTALQSTIAAMMAHMETPLPIPVLASETGKTVRSLERLFKKHLGTSPAKFYRKLRLEKVRHLLWHTNLSVLEIAVMTGFPSPSHLSRLYQAQFGTRPSEDRDSKRVRRGVE